MEIRRTTADDLPAAYEVFRVAIGELYGRHNLKPPGPPAEVFRSMHAHLLRTDGDRCHVVVDEGRIVAFVAALAREHSWHLASLFVLPESQGRGLGRRLLDLAWGESCDRRFTLTDAIQPVSNGLYAKRGLIPTTPMIQLAGEPRVECPRLLEPAEPDPTSVSMLDRSAYGFDRASDHGLWQGHAPCTVWRRDGDPVAYTYTWPHGRIGPLAARDAETAGLALEAALAELDGQPASVVAPGTAASVVSAALRAGLRLHAPPGLLLLSPRTPAPDSLAISSYTLL